MINHDYLQKMWLLFVLLHRCIKNTGAERSKVRLTCFSQAVGTSRRNSDRLPLIRSLRRFSMIWNRQETEGASEALGLRTRRSAGRPTPLRRFLAISCAAGDARPTGSLHRNPQKSLESAADFNP